MERERERERERESEEEEGEKEERVTLSAGVVLLLSTALVATEAMALPTLEDTKLFHHPVPCVCTLTSLTEPSAISRALLEGLEPALSTFTGRMLEYSELISGSSRYAWEMSEWTDTQADRQTDGQTDRQTDRQTGGRTDRWTELPLDRMDDGCCRFCCRQRRG